MDVILNDFSLQGQYASLDDFAESLIKNVFPCMELSKVLPICFLLKSYNTYNQKVTQTETLMSCLRNCRSNTAFQYLKAFISQYIIRQPYWEDNQKTPPEVLANCLTEAFFRNGALLSFVPNKGYVGKCTTVFVKEKNEKVFNVTDKKSFLECLDEKKLFPLACNNISFGGTSCKFSVHTGQSESRHKEPHFHIRTADGSKTTTVSLLTFDLLVEKQFYEEQLLCFRKEIEIARLERNKFKLVELWNYYHPERQIS